MNENGLKVKKHTLMSPGMIKVSLGRHLRRKHTRMHDIYGWESKVPSGLPHAVKICTTDTRFLYTIQIKVIITPLCDVPAVLPFHVVAFLSFFSQIYFCSIVFVSGRAIYEIFFKLTFQNRMRCWRWHFKINFYIQYF